MRIIATMTVPDLGLIEEEEFISTDETLKSAFLQMDWAKPYDETLPLPPKGLNKYEPGMIYPKDRFILNNNSLYQSNTVTSNTWVFSEVPGEPSEWDLIINGLPST